jgi:hypothetical protein
MHSLIKAPWSGACIAFPRPAEHSSALHGQGADRSQLEASSPPDSERAAARLRVHRVKISVYGIVTAMHRVGRAEAPSRP